MVGELSGTVFEWLLAEWAGFGDNPSEVFPSLNEAEPQELLGELNVAIQGAQTYRHNGPLVEHV